MAVIEEMVKNRNYERARRNWNKIGIDPIDQETIETLISEIEFFTRPLSIIRDPDEVMKATMENAEILKQIEQKYGIENYEKKLPEEVENLSVEAGLEKIYSHAKKEEPVALIGKPGSGKTTLLKIIEKEGITTIDEFWEMRPEDQKYHEKSSELYKTVWLGKPVVVASAQLENNPLIKIVAYLKTDEETRMHNLRTRTDTPQWMSASDKIRTEYSEAFATVDNFLYGLQAANADLVLDARSIRY